MAGDLPCLKGARIFSCFVEVSVSLVFFSSFCKNLGVDYIFSYNLRIATAY